MKNSLVFLAEKKRKRIHKLSPACAYDAGAGMIVLTSWLNCVANARGHSRPWLEVEVVLELDVSVSSPSIEARRALFRRNTGGVGKTEVVLDNPKHFCSSGKLLSKIVVPVDASKRSKKDACAPIFTASSVFASTHACGPAGVAALLPSHSSALADTFRPIEASRFRKTVEDAIPPNADKPMSICGMRWPVTPTDAPASVMLGPAETDTELVPCWKEPLVELF